MSPKWGWRFFRLAILCALISIFWWVRNPDSPGQAGLAMAAVVFAVAAIAIGVANPSDRR